MRSFWLRTSRNETNVKFFVKVFRNWFDVNVVTIKNIFFLWYFFVINNNQIFITGSFEGDAQFGDTTLYNESRDDGFFAKYNQEGSLIWVKQISGSGYIYSTDIVTDSNDNIKTGAVTLKFSYCRKEERNRYGENAGKTPFGKTYLKRNLLGVVKINDYPYLNEFLLFMIRNVLCNFLKEKNNFFIYDGAGGDFNFNAYEMLFGNQHIYLDFGSKVGFDIVYPRQALLNLSNRKTVRFNLSENLFFLNEDKSFLYLQGKIDEFLNDLNIKT